MNLIGEKQNKLGHEEADASLISYMLDEVSKGKERIIVTSDDTDIFVLLVYYCWRFKLNCEVMIRKINDKCISVQATAESLRTKCLELPQMHALSGCDTVSYPFGKGKLSAVNVLMKTCNLHLDTTGDTKSSDADIIAAGTSCFVSRSGGKAHECTNMNHLRYKLYSSKKKQDSANQDPTTDR